MMVAGKNNLFESWEVDHYCKEVPFVRYWAVKKKVLD
jgi:hypothetical protein